MEFFANVLNWLLPLPRRHRVPDLLGLTTAQANDRLLRSEYVLGGADGDDGLLVVDQSPRPGTKLKAWSPVYVTLGDTK